MDWRSSAACTDSDADFFDPPIDAAKRVCGSCPVTKQCLAFAMSVEVDEHGQALGQSSRFGVYGGLSARERWALDYAEKADRRREQQRIAKNARYARLTPEQRRANRGKPDRERELKRARDRAYSKRRRADLVA